jgi:signal transduction histidine kinase
MLYFFIRWRIRLNLEAEFSHFNQFLGEIELLTEKIHDVYNEETNLSVNSQNTYSTEQIIINRAISRLLEEIRKANQSLREAISASEQKRFEDELTRTALQVVHDIGSPLAVLEAIVQSASLMLPEDSRVAIRNAATKIRDIINSLLKKAKRDLLSMDEGALSQQLLHSLIHQVATEKRLQYRSNDQINIHFDFNKSSYGLFAYVKVADFSRIMSNLINNAFESIVSAVGDIYISLLDEGDRAVIKISDNGKGIPSDLISKLGKLGVTYGKFDGHGLGLFHAKTTVENWGGELEIQSQVGKGTTVSIHLPKSKAPTWFLPELKICNNQTIVIIDDDESIHAVWKERFREFQNENAQPFKLLHFYSPDELTEWKQSNDSMQSNMIYLCDYEFIGSSENGIELITKLRLNYFTILVTSRFYMDDVITECESSSLKLLPKDMAIVIPIVAFN